MIVVLSHADDPHAMQVIGALEARGREVLLLDLATLPARASLTVDYDGAADTAPDLRWRTDAGDCHDLGAVTSVWWRRPQAVSLETLSDPRLLAFAAGEWHEALSGLWQLIDAPWMNPPVLDDVAARKLLQLKLARDLGLTVPRTLVTSEPSEAIAFLERSPGARTICKTFSCTYDVWRETRLVGVAEREAIEAVRLAPVIFQEYVEGNVDLRVTIVGGEVFAAAIHSGETAYPVDFRMSLGQARVVPTTLPDGIVQRLHLLMERLGIVYGAFDLRRTPDGDHVFLEVNTAGEFLFIEERTEQPITDAVAGWLAEPAEVGLSAPVAA